jgi:DNA-binding transcriptional LysR family regulator
MSDLDLNDVRTYVAVAQAGTFTAAARQLQLPTSTVSRALTRLENTWASSWCGGAPEVLP